MRERTLPWAAEVESRRRTLVHAMASIFEDVDFIVTPMSSMPPFAAAGPMPTEIEGVEVTAGCRSSSRCSPIWRTSRRSAFRLDSSTDCPSDSR